MLGGGGITLPFDSPGNVPPSCLLRMEEVEWVICWGHQHGLPHLDPQADVSTVQSGGYQTTKEEIRDLYHQVYKLRRLPASLPCGLQQVHELTRDVVSSLKYCLRWRGGDQLRGM